jgi:deoxyhypusine monooxygenase
MFNMSDKAAEAMAAIGDPSVLPLLRSYLADESEHAAVRETCDIAIAKLEWDNGEGKSEAKAQRYIYIKYPFSCLT